MTKIIIFGFNLIFMTFRYDNLHAMIKFDMIFGFQMCELYKNMAYICANDELKVWSQLELKSEQKL